MWPGLGPSCLPVSHHGAVSESGFSTAPLGEFPFPVSSPVPGPGPQVRGREVFLTPTATPPLSSASRGVKRVGCTFPYLHTKQLCVALPWSCPSQPTMGRRKWGGVLSPQGGKSRGSCAFVLYAGQQRQGWVEWPGWRARVACIGLCSFPPIWASLSFLIPVISR